MSTGTLIPPALSKEEVSLAPLPYYMPPILINTAGCPSVARFYLFDPVLAVIQSAITPEHFSYPQETQ